MVFWYFCISLHVYCEEILPSWWCDQFVFSSLGLKAHVKFPDCLSSICPCVCLFTFSSRNIGQSHLAWNILRFLVNGFQVVQMKANSHFQGEIIMKLWKCINQIKKFSSPESLGQIHPKLGTKHPWLKGIQFFF